MPNYEARKAVGLLLAIAAHTEKSLPDTFPPATVERLSRAAVELLTGTGELSFETATVVRRIRESVQARSSGEPWGAHLLGALSEVAP